MGDVNTNDNAPSAADSMGNTAEDGGLAAVASEATEKVTQAVGQAKVRAGKMYRAGNEQMSRAVDPFPAVIVAAAVGFAAGYLIAVLDRD